MKALLTVLITTLSVGCISVKAPPLIDRHTVMESEAAGEWPELEKRFQDKALSEGPTAFPKEPQSKRKQRVYRVLNGDLTTPAPAKR